MNRRNVNSKSQNVNAFNGFTTSTLPYPINYIDVVAYSSDDACICEGCGERIRERKPYILNLIKSLHDSHCNPLWQSIFNADSADEVLEIGMDVVGEFANAMFDTVNNYFIDEEVFLDEINLYFINKTIENVSFALSIDYDYEEEGINVVLIDTNETEEDNLEEGYHFEFMDEDLD